MKIDYQLTSEENKKFCDEYLKNCDQYLKNLNPSYSSFKIVFAKFYHYGREMKHTGLWDIKCTIVIQWKHEFRKINNIPTVVERIKR